MIRVLFFGKLAGVAGNAEMEMPAANDTDQLRQMLEDRFPDLNRESYVLARNLEITNGNTPLSDGDEVALLPPYAGG